MVQRSRNDSKKRAISGKKSNAYRNFGNLRRWCKLCLRDPNKRISAKDRVPQTLSKSEKTYEKTGSGFLYEKMMCNGFT